MYNSYYINPYKLRKLAALNTLYKLGAFNAQQWNDMNRLNGSTAEHPISKKVKEQVELDKLIQKPKAISQEAIDNAILGNNDMLKRQVLNDGGGKGGKIKLTRRLLNAMNSTGKHMYKHRGKYTGGGAALATLLAGGAGLRQHHKDSKRLADAYEKFQQMAQQAKNTNDTLARYKGRSLWKRIINADV